jgi:hypothetical protein
MLMPYISNNAGMYKGTLAVGTILTADDFNAAIEEAQGSSEIIPLLCLCSNASDVEYAGGAIFTSMETIPIVAGHKYRVKEIAHKTFLEGTEDEISMDIYVYEELSEGKSIQEVYDKLDNISPTDPNSLALAQFFGVTLLEGYEFMQDTEVCDELEDIMQLVDPDLTAAQAAAITAQTLNPSES